MWSSCFIRGLKVQWLREDGFSFTRWCRELSGGDVAARGPRLPTVWFCLVCVVGWICTQAPGGRKGWRGEAHFSSAECDPAVAHVTSAHVNWPEPPRRAAREAGMSFGGWSHTPLKLLLAEKREEGFLALGLTLEQLLRLGIRGHYQSQGPPSSSFDFISGF